MSAAAFPEGPGLRQAAMTGRGVEPRRAVVQAEEAAKKQPERVSLRRPPQGEVEANQRPGSCCLTFELSCPRRQAL